jgi:hypothetical protein
VVFQLVLQKLLQTPLKVQQKCHFVAVSVAKLHNASFEVPLMFSLT